MFSCVCLSVIRITQKLLDSVDYHETYYPGNVLHFGLDHDHEADQDFLTFFNILNSFYSFVDFSKNNSWIIKNLDLVNLNLEVACEVYA